MTKVNRGLFTSFRGDWKTPRALFQALDAEFILDDDPCPAKPLIDGLVSEWGNINFVNPPYGKEITKWIQKGYAQALKGKTVVFLLPNGSRSRSVPEGVLPEWESPGVLCRGTCWWAGRDNTALPEPASSHENCLTARRACGRHEVARFAATIMTLDPQTFRTRR